MNYILKLNICKNKIIFKVKQKRRHPHGEVVVVSQRQRQLTVDQFEKPL